MTRDEEVLLLILQEIREEMAKPPSPGSHHRIGICWQASCINETLVRKGCHWAIPTELMLLGMFPRWPEFNGCEHYPVPIPEAECHPGSYYMDHRDIMWDRTTEYGAARWRLLEWLIQDLESR